MLLQIQIEIHVLFCCRVYKDWLDDYEKNLSCALERGPFLQQILFAKLGREGRIFCTEMKCLTTATLLLASCTPTRTQHFVYVT